jgi:hypothetical protein
MWVGKMSLLATQLVTNSASGDAPQQCYVSRVRRMTTWT